MVRGGIPPGRGPLPAIVRFGAGPETPNSAGFTVYFRALSRCGGAGRA